MSKIPNYEYDLDMLGELYIVMHHTDGTMTREKWTKELQKTCDDEIASAVEETLNNYEDLRKRAYHSGDTAISYGFAGAFTFFITVATYIASRQANGKDKLPFQFSSMAFFLLTVYAFWRAGKNYSKSTASVKVLEEKKYANALEKCEELSKIYKFYSEDPVLEELTADMTTFGLNSFEEYFNKDEDIMDKIEARINDIRLDRDNTNESEGLDVLLNIYDNFINRSEREPRCLEEAEKYLEDITNSRTVPSIKTYQKLDTGYQYKKH